VIKISIPSEIRNIVHKLNEAGHQAFPVGGCVRDVLRGVKPQDWDVTTNAKPEEMQKVFPESFYENKFGTVTVLTGSEDVSLKEVEITPFRVEAKYSDKRHPDEVRFASNIEEDLKRRDFTINAMAFMVEKESPELIDLFGGQVDLKNSIVRTVGDPNERFGEDALRMMRAVRFAVNLKFEIEKDTFAAIQKNSNLLAAISQERIRDEFIKIIMAGDARRGIDLLRESGLLAHIIPEILEGYGTSQNKHHIYDVYEHCVRALDFSAKSNFEGIVRIASLLHDVGKPRVKKGEGEESTFYGHEVVGAKMTEEILNRLKFPNKDAEIITKLVRYHLFYYNVGEVGENSVRRLVRQVGIENTERLLQVRMADRVGSGVPKAEPYKLRHLKYVIEKISHDPISVKMLKVGGSDVMRILSVSPSPKIGQILDILLGEVLDSPELNREDLLTHRVEELGKMSDNELVKMAEEARKAREEVQMKEDQMTKQKYWVV
jgi:poly(A) polymerase/tRNA nucleotidyltransferase (CCA-adding enzyme)